MAPWAIIALALSSSVRTARAGVPTMSELSGKVLPSVFSANHNYSITAWDGARVNTLIRNGGGLLLAKYAAGVFNNNPSVHPGCNERPAQLASFHLASIRFHLARDLHSYCR